jgi:prephenate dehydrogenase
MAVRRVWPKAEIRLWARSIEKLEEAQQRGLADMASTEPADVATGASLIILATPIGFMPELAQAIAPACSEGSLITDVGSVKGSVVAALEPIFHGTQANFVGSHPMAGSERAGIEAARDDLFDGARCLLTPTANTSGESVQRLAAFWHAMGCSTEVMSASDHDRKVARISHLPHLTASALVLAALSSDPSAQTCVANGFRDSTRIASGDPTLWTGILTENRSEVLAGLTALSTQITELVEIIQNSNEEALRRFLTEAKQLRDPIPAGMKKYGND